MGWGPEWVEEWTPLQYLAKLQEKVAKTQSQGRYKYSAIDQSEEAIYQATTKPQFGGTATLLQLALQQLKRNPERDSVVLPPNLTLINIINNFQRIHESTTSQMKINQVQVGNSKPQPRQRFEYRNKVTCKACGMFGHDIERGQVCRFLAMLVLSSEYLEKNSNKTKENRDQFKRFNDSKIIKQLTVKGLFDKAYDEALFQRQLDNRAGQDSQLMCILTDLDLDKEE